MTSYELHRQKKDCTGKAGYGDKSSAKAALKRHQCNPAVRDRRNLGLYRCTFCGNFHLGHADPGLPPHATRG